MLVNGKKEALFTHVPIYLQRTTYVVLKQIIQITYSAVFYSVLVSSVHLQLC